MLVQLSGSNFPINARSDGTDIRFTDVSGNELSYWIESWDYAGRNAKIWMKVPSISASKVTTVRMYYGNPSAGSSGNGDATFELFDDFNGVTIDTNKWNIETPARVSAGVLHDNKYTLRLDVSQLSNTEVGLFSKSLFPQSRSFHAKVRDGYSEDGGFTWSHSSDVFGFRDYNKKTIEVVAYTFGDTWKGLNYNDSPYSVCELKNPRPRSNWIEIITTRYFDKSRFSLIESSGRNINKCNISDYITNNNLSVVLSSFHSYSYINKIFYVDWVYVTKFVDTEPTITLGAEQPVSTLTPTSTLTPIPIVAQASDQKTITNSIGMEFVLIPQGEFDMGSPSNEKDRGIQEGPVHHVKISKAFYMGKYEVTQKQWRDVMGNEPSYFKGDNLPVSQVSWNDVQKFIKKLNEKEGTNKYRLPSEAEWEYAARSGTTTRFSFGDDESKLSDYAWCYSNSEKKAHDVGQKKPNPWGLYDMHGNVEELVQDNLPLLRGSLNYNGAPTDGSSWESGDGTYRVARGGSWGSGVENTRSASRHSVGSDTIYGDLGFRLLRVL